MNILSGERKKSLELFEKYMNELNEDKCLEIEEIIKITDSVIREHLASIGVSNISDKHQLEKARRNEIIRTVKNQ